MRDESVLRDESVDCAVEAVDLVDINVGGMATEAAVLEGGLEGCLWQAAFSWNPRQRIVEYC